MPTLDPLQVLARGKWEYGNTEGAGYLLLGGS
jgi:hypothetical protein